MPSSLDKDMALVYQGYISQPWLSKDFIYSFPVPEHLTCSHVGGGEGWVLKKKEQQEGFPFIMEMICKFQTITIIEMNKWHQLYWSVLFFIINEAICRPPHIVHEK